MTVTPTNQATSAGGGGGNRNVHARPLDTSPYPPRERARRSPEGSGSVTGNELTGQQDIALPLTLQHVEQRLRHLGNRLPIRGEAVGG